MKRRHFVKTGFSATLASAMPGLLGGLASARAEGRISGALAPGPGYRIHPAFDVAVISPAESLMDDGIAVPPLHDGLGCFGTSDGGYVLVRNHEIREPGAARRPDIAYNPALSGGTTTVELNPDLSLRRHYLSLDGTSTNCNGGVTPWGSWLSCEEVFADHAGISHGYVFEVYPGQVSANPVPLRALGRFMHEACGWFAPHNQLYMTEDQNDGNLYRFIPESLDNPLQRGRLQALRLPDTPGNPIGDQRYRCDWVDILEPDPAADTVRLEAQSKGAATFHRPEGIWVSGDAILFACTTDGSAGQGAIYSYTPDDRQTGKLRRVVDAQPGVIDRPDSLVETPGGGLLVCEDGFDRVQRILHVAQSGEVGVFAEGERCGWTGITFSPDQRVLFVNQQYLGRTLAVTGNWSLLDG